MIWTLVVLIYRTAMKDSFIDDKSVWTTNIHVMIPLIIIISVNQCRNIVYEVILLH
jgi:hypothetical protein